MRPILTALALASWVGLAAYPAVAQTQPEPGKKDAPPATTAPQPAAPPPAANKAAEPTTTATNERRKRRVGKARHRRHAHATRRHRAVRHHRHGWRDVWIYRAHDRHGDRHYEYVSRKLAATSRAAVRIAVAGARRPMRIAVGICERCGRQRRLAWMARGLRPRSFVAP